MKLLIDQNISFRLKARIAGAFPDAHHVKDLNLIDLPDASIFDYARQHQFDAILTLDEDFHNLVLVRGIPPKIIWLRTGNCSTPVQAQVLLRNLVAIQTFMGDLKNEVLEIFR
jgi:predicted nuclease of predicted toxin-antitoxin system